MRSAVFGGLKRAEEAEEGVLVQGAPTGQSGVLFMVGGHPFEGADARQCGLPLFLTPALTSIRDPRPFSVTYLPRAALP